MNTLSKSRVQNTFSCDRFDVHSTKRNEVLQILEIKKNEREEGLTRSKFWKRTKKYFNQDMICNTVKNKQCQINRPADDVLIEEEIISQA